MMKFINCGFISNKNLFWYFPLFLLFPNILFVTIANHYTRPENTEIMTEDEPYRAEERPKASSWQNSTYWTNLSEFHADGFAYIWCWIKLLPGVWMTVDIVLDVFQTIKYFTKSKF